MIKIAAKILSHTLSPLLIPTYLYIVLVHTTILSMLPTESIWLIIGIIAIFTAIIPAIIFNWRGGKSDRGKDYVNYAIIAVCYLWTAYLLTIMGIPAWMASFLVAGTGVAIILALLKNYNISEHMAGIGLFLGGVYALSKLHSAIPLNYLIATIFVIGLSGSALTYLKDYSLGELVTGIILGFIWSCAAFFIGVLIL